MSHFYARIPVSARKTIASARGHTSTGIVTQAASWNGAIETELFEKDGEDWYIVRQIPWHGSGCGYVIATGKVGTWEKDDMQGYAINRKHAKTLTAPH